MIEKNKFNLLVCDPPWSFDDRLSMSDVKRSAEAQYPVLNIEEIKKLRVKDITADDAVLALWIPSSLLQEGLDTMKSWGFRQTQTHIWVKTKKDIFKELLVEFGGSVLLSTKESLTKKSILAGIESFQNSFDWDDLLGFGMGRLFRQCHEVCLLGVRGKPYQNLKNKSQRSVHFGTNLRHSAKPEILQERLEKMFPEAKKLELFARRKRKDWTCLGNDSPESIGEDIRDSIAKLIAEIELCSTPSC